MKPLANQSGVYQITCKPTGKRYVGSAKKFRARWYLHKLHLQRNTHHAPHLQHSWNKYGAEAFEFEVLLVCDPSMTLVYEQIVMDSTKPEFNVCPTAGNMRGLKHTHLAKANMKKGQRQARAKHLWKGEIRCVADIAEMENCDPTLLMARLLTLNKTVEEALEMGDSQYVLYEHDGKKQGISAWAREIGVHQARLLHYIKTGSTMSQAIHEINVAEKRMSMSEFCRINSVNLQTFKSRVQKGMGVMDAITIPSKQMDNSWRNKEVTHG